MSENDTTNNDEGQDSFADLLESYSSETNEDIGVGDKIAGEILSIGEDRIYVDTGTKIDGVIEKRELLDESGEFPYQLGDMVELYVVSFSGDEIVLSKAMSGLGALRALETAFSSAVPVEGKVKSLVKGGFQVEISQRRAFCPMSQMDLRYVDKPEIHVGNTYRFLILKFEERGRNIVVSRRKLLDMEMKEERTKFLSTIQVDDQLEGRVTKLMPYGAFVELFPGIEGMVHISELSWSRVNKAEEVVQAGQSIQVKILGIEWPKTKNVPKISLSIKQISGDPWERVVEDFHVGDRVEGTVRRCAAFGAFVEIAPGIEGLVHISEMSHTRRVLKPEDVVQVDETVSVVVKDIDPKNRRISLSMKDAEGDPWKGVEDRFTVGQTTEGVLEKKERFGYFITLEPGVTGLLPKSKFRDAEDQAGLENLKEGDPIKVVVAEMDIEQRKLTLSPGITAGEKEWKTYSKDSGSGLGSLGEKLEEALKDQD